MPITTKNVYEITLTQKELDTIFKYLDNASGSFDMDNDDEEEILSNFTETLSENATVEDDCI